MASDVWIGAAATVIGVALGGGISFAVSRQQLRDAQLQRADDAARERDRRSADRRYQAYSDFLARARSFRNAAEAYYLPSAEKPSVSDLDVLLRAANDASSLVFLVVESDGTFEGCRSVLRALHHAQALIHGLAPGWDDDPWAVLNVELGQSLREFQNAARGELGVEGPTAAWIAHRHADHKAEGGTAAGSA